MSGTLYLPSSKTLKNVDELVPQERLNRVYERMWERGHQDLVEKLTLAAYIQPPTDRDRIERAYFRVISPHPKQRFAGQELQTIASMPIEEWRQAEDEKFRFAGLPDPLLSIFAGLVRKHMETYNNLKELND